MSKIFSRSVVIAGALAASTMMATSAIAAGLTQGHVVALRVGDNTTQNNTTTGRVFLDEFLTTGGTSLSSVTSTTELVQSIDVSALANAGGSQFSLIGQEATNIEGMLNISNDNKYIVFGGYLVAPGTAGSIQFTSASVNNRGMARVKIADGSADFSLKLTSASITGNIRGAYSTNGNDFYAATFDTASGLGQLYYINSSMPIGSEIGMLGPPTAGTVQAPRNVTGYQGNLYITQGNTGAGRSNGIYQVGSGFPTTDNQAQTTIVAGLAPFKNMEQFAFESLNAPTSGRLWIADQATADSMTKWDLSAGTWTETGANVGTQTIFTFGCALGKDVNNNDVVFATMGSANPNNSIRMINRNTAAVTYIAQFSTGATLVGTYRGLVVVPPPPAEVKDWSKY